MAKWRKRSNTFPAKFSLMSPSTTWRPRSELHRLLASRLEYWRAAVEGASLWLVPIDSHRGMLDY